MYSSSHITDQTQITYELHTGAPKTKHEDRRPMIRWKNRQPGAQRVYCGAGQAYSLKLSCLFRACSPKIQSTERVVSTFDLDMGVSFERSAFMGYLVHSAVTPARRATPLWRVASDRRRGAERSGTELSLIRGSAADPDGHKCAGWTDPDRAPPACELYNSLGGLRNIPLSFSACCVTGNALLRPSERPPARTPGTARTGSAARAPRQSLSYATHSHINSMPVVRRHLP